MLGRHLDAVERERERLQSLKDSGTHTDDAIAILWERSRGLRHLIGTMRPVTLADAAVSAHIAAELVSGMVNNQHTIGQLLAIAEVAERLLFGITPIMATVADLDFGDTFAEDRHLADQRFAGLESAA